MNFLKNKNAKIASVGYAAVLVWLLIVCTAHPDISRFIDTSFARKSADTIMSIIAYAPLIVASMIAGIYHAYALYPKMSKANRLTIGVAIGTGITIITMIVIFYATFKFHY